MLRLLLCQLAWGKSDERTVLASLARGGHRSVQRVELMLGYSGIYPVMVLRSPAVSDLHVRLAAGIAAPVTSCPPCRADLRA